MSRNGPVPSFSERGDFGPASSCFNPFRKDGEARLTAGIGQKMTWQRIQKGRCFEQRQELLGNVGSKRRDIGNFLDDGRASIDDGQKILQVVPDLSLIRQLGSEESQFMLGGLTENSSRGHTRQTEITPFNMPNPAARFWGSSG
jgi:hypothetical protein